VSFTLVDNYTEKSVSLREDQYYWFDITADADSKNNERFVLIIRKSEPIIVTFDGTALKIDDEKNIQWYFNDEPVAGATSSTYRPQESGRYRVVVRRDTCQLTGEIEVSVTALEHALKNTLKVYPNPAKDIVNIDIPVDLAATSGRLLNIYGHTVAEIDLNRKSRNNPGASIDLTHCPAGIYFLRVYVKNTTLTIKVIKM
jgi:hypothetical protein